MKTEDIIEGLNIFLEEERKKRNIKESGHFVMLRTVEINSSFKAYKTYKVEIFFVLKKAKKSVLTVQNTSRVIDGQEEAITRKLNTELTASILSFIGSDTFKAIIEGSYNGDIDQ